MVISTSLVGLTFVLQNDGQVHLSLVVVGLDAQDLLVELLGLVSLSLLVVDDGKIEDSCWLPILSQSLSEVEYGLLGVFSNLVEENA